MRRCKIVIRRILIRRGRTKMHNTTNTKAQKKKRENTKTTDHKQKV